MESDSSGVSASVVDGPLEEEVGGVAAPVSATRAETSSTTAMNATTTIETIGKDIVSIAATMTETPLNICRDSMYVYYNYNV